ncbi:PDGLE domain-containing protein [Micromonospora phytophila]|uniref:PDGLE domain-containing protein n=1 Tax=Micromonospora phytophila TaxID=709888 RepID=UPI00202F28CD|nr:PDGLE domain-containing protein [Micromonospora phytophila]MCM0675188.1 PDGLE domain-containing protein [Micromonospora phytophila]
MRKRSWGFVVGGLLVALLLAGVVSNLASSHPDGLDSSLREGCTVDAEGEISGGSCPAQRETEHEVGGPLADYGVAGVDNDLLSTGLSGVVGVLLTFALAGGVFWLVRRRGPEAGDSADQGSTPPGDTADRRGTPAGTAS